MTKAEFKSEYERIEAQMECGRITPRQALALVAIAALQHGGIDLPNSRMAAAEVLPLAGFTIKS
jgi:hypothetical protein